MIQIIIIITLVIPINKMREINKITTKVIITVIIRIMTRIMIKKMTKRETGTIKMVINKKIMNK